MEAGRLSDPEFLRARRLAGVQVVTHSTSEGEQQASQVRLTGLAAATEASPPSPPSGLGSGSVSGGSRSNRISSSTSRLLPPRIVFCSSEASTPSAAATLAS